MVRPSLPLLATDTLTVGRLAGDLTVSLRDLAFVFSLELSNFFQKRFLRKG